MPKKILKDQLRFKQVVMVHLSDIKEDKLLGLTDYGRLYMWDGYQNAWIAYPMDIMVTVTEEA